MPQTVLAEVRAGDINALRTALLAVDDAKFLAVHTEGSVTFVVSKT